MAFTSGQLTSLQEFAAARRARIHSAPIPADVMVQHLEDGAAELLGDFPGSPVRYLERWWRLGEESTWEALDDVACAVLDDDAKRWRLAVSTATAPQPGGQQ